MLPRVMGGPARVRTIGLVSGAGADHLEDAIAESLDAFLTGEPSERSMWQMAPTVNDGARTLDTTNVCACWNGVTPRSRSTFDGSDTRSSPLPTT